MCFESGNRYCETTDPSISSSGTYPLRPQARKNITHTDRSFDDHEYNRMPTTVQRVITHTAPPGRDRIGGRVGIGKSDRSRDCVSTLILKSHNQQKQTGKTQKQGLVATRRNKYLYMKMLTHTLPWSRRLDFGASLNKKGFTFE